MARIQTCRTDEIAATTARPSGERLSDVAPPRLHATRAWARRHRRATPAEREPARSATARANRAAAPQARRVAAAGSSTRAAAPARAGPPARLVYSAWSQQERAVPLPHRSSRRESAWIWRQDQSKKAAVARVQTCRSGSATTSRASLAHVLRGAAAETRGSARPSSQGAHSHLLGSDSRAPWQHLQNTVTARLVHATQPSQPYRQLALPPQKCADTRGSRRTAQQRRGAPARRHYTSSDSVNHTGRSRKRSKSAQQVLRPGGAPTTLQLLVQKRG